MINKVVLVGRIAHDLELKYTQNSIANVRFRIAINRSRKDENGNNQADFINCVAWREQAENLVKYQSKGSLIGVDGRIETGSYQGQDGNMRYTTDVIASSIQYLESKGGNNGNHVQQENQSTNNEDFNNGYDAYNTEPDFNNTIDISDDDLPF